MKTKLLISLYLPVFLNLFISGAVSAQVKNNMSKSGIDTSRTEAKAMIQTRDGGFAITGFIQSYKGGSSDVYVVKLDGNGKTEWTRSVGGPKDEEGSSIVQTKDGGYAIAGYTNSYGAGGEDVYVVKLDKTGNVKWTKTLGGKSDDRGFSIIEAKDGGLVIAGSSDSYKVEYEYIIKLDSQGNVKWSTGIPGSACALVESKDGNVAVCGNGVYPWQDYMIVSKIDTSGNTTWNKVITDSIVNYGGVIHNINQ